MDMIQIQEIFHGIIIVNYALANATYIHIHQKSLMTLPMYKPSALQALTNTSNVLYWQSEVCTKHIVLLKK